MFEGHYRMVETWNRYNGDFHTLLVYHLFDLINSFIKQIFISHIS